ncbi:MAG: histone deacetylase family protein [Pseudomonadota bacterium]
MSLIILTHPSGHAHQMPAGHAESPARLDAVMAALSAPGLAEIERQEAPRATDADILRCHPQRHIDRITAALPETGLAALDADTYLSPRTDEAARHAVGGVVRGVDLVLGGAAPRAFSAMRPPGHHAETESPMGFCLYGAVAIGAKHALDHHGLKRVAVIDFDVHHGNGTQDLLWTEPRALFASTHQMPLYPGTGGASETGAHGQVHNHPLPPNSGRAAMQAAYRDHILPAVRAFAPQLILLSAGFDAHTRDPLAQLNWEVEDYIWLTREIVALADEICEGRIVSALEGGYDLEALAASVAAHVEILRGAPT